MNRRNWTLLEDQYLIESNATKSIRDQAKTLNRTRHSVNARRQELIEQGKLDTNDRYAHRPWTKDDHNTLIELIRDGRGVKFIAQRLRRTVRSIYFYCQQFGGIDVLRYSDSSMVRSAEQTGILMGVDGVTILRWANKYKAIKASNNIATGSKRTRKQTELLISDDALMDFLQNRRFWMLWKPESITDRDWREYATEIRAKANGSWLTTSQIAERLGVAQITIRHWATKGVFNHLECVRLGQRRYFWSADIDRFVPPLERAA